MDRSFRLFVVLMIAIAAVAFPSLVQADSAHTGMHIVDPETASEQADVSGGRLLVDTRPNLTSPLRVIGSDSTATSSHAGLYIIPASLKAAITSLTFANVGANPVTASLYSFQPSSGGCTTSGITKGNIAIVRIPANDTISVAHPSPYVAPSVAVTGPWCLKLATTGAGSVVYVTIVGYLTS